MSRDQPREPNGRWDTVDRPTTGVSLGGEMSAEEIAAYNAQGTYRYPVRALNLQQHLAFWQNVEVPDSVMRNVEAQYRVNRKAEVERVVSNAITMFHLRDSDPSMGVYNWHGNRKLGRLREAEIQSWEKRAEQVEAETRASFNDWPEYIPATGMRNLLRAWGALAGGFDLTEEDQEIVRGHVFPGETLTVIQLIKKYRLTEIDRYLRETREENLSHKLRTNLEKINTKLDNQQ